MLEGGRTVGRYRILGFLGAGAMGEVYLADDPHIGRKLAIKTVRLAGRPQELEERKRRLLREARAAGSLLHPHVVTLFDAGEAEGLLFLAFEYVEGTDLAARLEKGPLSLRDVLRIVRHASEALDYAHSQGIVHRDIKPSNILLENSGRVKVADFGIAKMAGQNTELTIAGSVMGSPQYLSPEQIRGEDLDGRSDIFSLGVVLYELLSGTRPFNGETITTLVYQILHNEPPPIAELRAVPPRLEALLARMLAKDRDERMATAGEAARELGAIEVELSDETLSAPAGSDMLAATLHLPRRTTSSLPPVAPGPQIPPPPPSVVVPEGAARTVVPPPPPPAPSAPTQPQRQVQPQPPPPAFQAPAAPAPAQGSGGSRVLWIALAAMLVLGVGVLAVGWRLWSGRDRGPAEPAAVATDIAQLSSDSTVPAPTEPAARTVVPPVEITPAPSSTPPRLEPAVETAPDRRPAPAEQRVQEVPRPVEPSPRPEPRPETVPRVRDRVPPPEPAPSRDPEPEPEPEPAERTRTEEAADRSVATGLDVVFQVTPPDSYVLVDGRVIGRADEWTGKKGGRTFTFPGAGSYLVKIRKPGMRDFRIAVEAGATGGTTPIIARLQALPAANVDTPDLRTIRVRDSISFKVQPPAATVSVDGQPMGSAREFGGGMGRKGWLQLPPGRHRISIDAPGFERQDVLVEVTPGADEAREKIEMVLTPGGSGG